MAWAERTETGDRAELPFTPRGDDGKRSTPMPTIASASSARASPTAISSNAATRALRRYRRRQPRAVLPRPRGRRQLLPAYDVAILDEAHQCEKYATAALTATLSAAGVGRMMRKLHRTYTVPAAFDAEIDEAMRRLQSVLARVPGERYPVAANDGVLELLPHCARRSTGSKTGYTPTG